MTASMLSTAIFKPLQDVHPRLGLLQVELGAPGDHVTPVLNELCRACLSGQGLRRPSTMARQLMPKDSCRGGPFSTGCSSPLRARRPSSGPPQTRMPSRSDSSRTSEMPFNPLLGHQLRNLLDELGFVDLVGDLGSTMTCARSSGVPPQKFAPVPGWLRGPIRRPGGCRCDRQMMPEVGKSGPGTISMRSSTSISGLRDYRMVASTISRRLCGGMLVAMPTAMPEEPLTSRLGRRVGRTVGSVSLSS